VRDARDALNQQQRIANICHDHAVSLCAQVELGAACHEKESRSCLDQFGITDVSPSPEFGIYLVHVSFELIEDEATRQRFQTIPTKLQLPREDIDRLIDIAPELLNEDPEFHTLIRDLGARVAD
jgi:hypothetical protein